VHDLKLGVQDFVPLQITWSLNYGQAFNETPDNVQINANIINNFVAIDQNTGATRRWEHNADNDKTAILNLHHTAKIGGATLHTSIGGLYRDKVRDSYFNEYIFKPFDPDKENPRELIKGIHWNNYDELKFEVNRYGNLSDPLNYDATERLSAGYLTTKLTHNRIQLIAGVRAEHTQQGYELRFTTEGAQNAGKQIYTDYLPNVHFKYNLTDNTNLRFSYVKAINRPSFFEIVPYNYINEEYKERGNPDLKRTLAHNYDLRYEFFPHPSEQFLAGVFYKSINDPIEFGFVPGYGQDTYYMPVNYGKAQNFGLELDAIKYFNWLGIKANYTFTQSNITTVKKKSILNPDPDAETNTLVEYVNQTRPLYGQAAQVANLSLLLHAPRSGWDAQVAFSYTGRRLVIVSQWLDDDTWQSGSVQMDISIDKQFKNGISLFCKASNLLNTPMIQYTKINSMNDKHDPHVAMYNGGIIDRKEYYHQNISLGIKYKL
jgi:TonB-dependent receptor